MESPPDGSINLTWNGVLSTICSSSAGKGERKCPVRLLDTIFLEESTGTIPDWYFTSKVGMISKKKGNKSTFPAVVDRFSKFALANTSNTRGYVGVTRSYVCSSSSSSSRSSSSNCDSSSGNGGSNSSSSSSSGGGGGSRRTFWSTDSLKHTLINVTKGAAVGRGTYLQVFLQPHESVDAIFIIEGTREGSSSNSSCTFQCFKRTYRGTAGESGGGGGSGTESITESAVPDNISVQMQSYIAEVIDFFEKNRGLRTRQVEAEFIVDDNEQVWLSCISKFTAVPVTDSRQQLGPEVTQETSLRKKGSKGHVHGTDSGDDSQSLDRLSKMDSYPSEKEEYREDEEVAAVRWAANSPKTSPKTQLRRPFLSIEISPDRALSGSASPQRSPANMVPLRGSKESPVYVWNARGSPLLPHQKSHSRSPSPFTLGHSEVASRVCEVSGVEKEFMKRQVTSGTLAVDSVKSHGRSWARVGDGGPGEQSNPQTEGFDELAAVLQDRVVVLEKQVASMALQLVRKDTELDAALDRLRKAKSDVDATRRAAEAEKAQLRDQKEREVLALKEKHMKDLASFANSPVGTMFDGGFMAGNTSNTGNPGARGQSTTEANRQLLEQMETMRVERKRLQDQFDDERRLVQYEATSKLAAQEALMKSEISELRTHKTSLEDRLLQASDDLSASRTKTDSLSVLCRQLESARDEAVEAQAKLRSDLKAEQLSMTTSKVQQAANAGSANHTNPSASADVEAAVKLCEAKFEAKLRQQANKLEFLKSQLSAEQVTSEELRATSDADRAKLDDLRLEMRARQQEADRLTEEAIAVAERRVERGYEDRMRELTSLQAKMKSVQQQLKEVLEEGAMAKQREEAAKATVLSRDAEQVALKAELEQLRGVLQSIRDQREQEEAKSGAKQNQEATVRRLDNERQYLKSQLASEITLKNEVQEALFLCQTQLAETQKRWNEDIESTKESVAKAQQDSAFAQQKAHYTVSTLEAEVHQLTLQNKELKEGFSKLRDQVRAEQLALENATMANHRLSEQLDDLKNESQRLRQTEETQNTAHERQISALTALMSETGERHTRELTLLREELGKQCLANSTSQNDTFHLLRSFDEERREKELQVAAGHIVEGFRRQKLHRVGTMFRIWSQHSVLVGVAAQFRVQMEELVRATLGEAKRDKEVSLESLRVDHVTTLEALENELRDEFSAEKEHLVRVATSEGAVLAARREELFQQSLREAEARFSQQMVLVREAGEESLAGAEEGHRRALAALAASHQDDLARAVREGLLRAETAQKEAEEAAHAEWTARLAQREEAFAEEVRRALLAADLCRVTEVQEERKKASARLTEDLTLLRTELLAEGAAALAAEATTHAQEMAALREQCETENAASVERLRGELNEERIAALRQQWDDTRQEIDALRAEWERDTADRLHLQDDDHQQKLSAKMEGLSATMESEKGRALKLEASKWKQALKEAEKRLALEVKQAHERGRDEREQEVRMELANADEKKQLEHQATLNDRLKAAMDAMQHEHAEKMAVLEARIQAQQEEAAAAAERVVDMQVAFEREKTDAVIEAEGALRERLALEWTDRMRQEMSAALEQAAALGRQELARHEELSREYEKTLLVQMDSQRAQLEMDNADALTAAAVSHAEYVQALEEKHQIAAEVALGRGREERDGQLQADMLVLEARSQADLHDLRRQLHTAQEQAAANSHWQTEFLKHVEESEKMLKKLEKARRAELKKITEELASEREVAKAGMAQIEGVLLDQHTTAIEALRQELSEAAARQVQVAREAWQAEAALLAASRSREVAEDLAAKLEEQMAISEAERARGLKLEASKWKQALKEAEKRMALEVAQAKAQGREEREQEARQERTSFEAHLTATFSVAAAAQKQMEIEAIEATHAEEMTQLRAGLERDAQTALAEAVAAAVQLAAADWSASVAEQIAAAVTAADDAHVATVASVRKEAQTSAADQLAVVREEGALAEAAKWQQRVDAMEAHHRTEMAAADEKIRQYVDAREEMKQFAATMEATHKAAVGVVGDELAAALGQIQSLETDRAQLQQWLDQSEEAQRCLEVDRRVERDQLVEGFEKERARYEHELGLNEGVKQQLFEEAEQRIRLLRESWEEESAKWVAESAAEVERKWTTKLEEHTLSVEADRTRGLKLEASKWKQALKEAEKRMALEVAQAKAQGREEREQELRLAQETIDEVKAAEQRTAEDRHRLELDALITEHEVRFAEWRATTDADRHTALQRIEHCTRELLTEEWTERLQAAVSAAVEKADAVHKAKLAKQQESLEEFKRDMVAQTQRVAEERNLLQERCECAETGLARVRADRRAEMERLQSDFEEERESLTAKMIAKHKKEMDACAAQVREEVDDQVEAATIKATRVLEERLAEAHREAIEQVNELTQEMNELRQANNEAALLAAAEATKLVDAQDTLYDTQQQLKAKQKESSLVAWKLATTAYTAKTAADKTIKEMQGKKAIDDDASKQRMQHMLSSMTFLVLQLSRSLATSNDLRGKIDASLRSYRLDDINEKRRRVKTLQKDIERLTADADDLHEQQGDIDEEVSRLEAQVRLVEDQLRTHNQASSTINGRINVAHAHKKKRLDGEFERLLSSIEQKRDLLNELEEQVGEKGRVRDERAIEMVDIEKELVNIMCEQQKAALALVQQMGSSVGDKCERLVRDARIPWPPPDTPTAHHVQALYEKGGALHDGLH